jgi:hypothetical protein
VVDIAGVSLPPAVLLLRFLLLLLLLVLLQLFCFIIRANALCHWTWWKLLLLVAVCSCCHILPQIKNPCGGT